MIGIFHREAGAQRIADRARDVTVQFRPLLDEVIGHGALGLERVGGAGGDDADGAGGGVLAEQRPLRPTQNLDPVDIEERRGELGTAAAIDAILIDGNIHIEGDVVHAGAEAADINHVVDAGARDIKIRNVILQRLQIAGLQIGDLLAAEHGHRDRHVLHVLLALLRGDGHGFDRAFLREDRRRQAG